MQIAMFTKPFASLSVDQTADILADLGVDGVDLTVRSREHVLPQNVETDLPRAQEIFAKRNLPVLMISTSITDPSDPLAEPIFRTAARCGIRELKLGYWPYAGFGRLRAQIADVRRDLAGIERLAREYGVRASVHIHSGETLSADAAILAMQLDGFDQRLLGAYVDPGHMMVEGSLGGWQQGLDLLSDRISIIGVKAFGWFRESDPASGETRWHPKMVPLSEGSVPWSTVFALLGRIGFDGTVSVASPYQSGQSWRHLSVSEIIEQTRLDLAYLRRAIAAGALLSVR
jgi:sugar phosphate isomerase/epimerase